MKAAYIAVRGADRVLNAFICILLSLCLLFGGYAMWDTWRIYQNAAVDSNLLLFRPNGANNALSFAELRKINPDICAWIMVDATRIDYPVVQGKDNTEYINMDVYRKFAVSGSIFLDYRNQRDFSDRYSILYGHHMDGGVMFGDLLSYADKTFFDEHSHGRLYTETKTYDLEVFAYVETSAYTLSYYVIPGSDEQMQNLMQTIRDTAIWYRDPGADGPVLALSTCASAATNGRGLVICRMRESAENAEENPYNETEEPSSVVTANP